MQAYLSFDSLHMVSHLFLWQDDFIYLFLLFNFILFSFSVLYIKLEENVANCTRVVEILFD